MEKILSNLNTEVVNSNIKTNKNRLAKLDFDRLKRLLVSLGIVGISSLSAQSTLAEMRTGTVINNRVSSFGSGVSFFNDKNRCNISNEHVMPQDTMTNYPGIKYEFIFGEVNKPKQDLLNEDFNSDNYSLKYSPEQIFHPKGFDAAFMSDSTKPCTQEFLKNELGVDFVPVQELIQRNRNEYLNQTTKVLTHRNISNERLYDNEMHSVNLKPLGITVNYMGSPTFLHITDRFQNIDNNEYFNHIGRGTSGSFAETKTPGKQSSFGLLNTMFEIHQLNFFKMVVKLDGTYDLQANLENEQKNQPEKIVNMEELLNIAIKEHGYKNLEEFYAQKGKIIGIVPFFSKEGMDQIDSLQNLK